MKDHPMSNSIATNTSDPYAALAKVAAEESGGAILKFSKGEWTSGDDTLNGATMLADMANLMVGWRKWSDNRIVDANIGLAAAGFVPKDRQKLGDLNKDEWPCNNIGQPTDPWQFGYYLRLSAEDGQVYTWSAASAGARRAVGDLTRQVIRKRQNPLVRLATSNYRHRVYGKVVVPSLEVVGWSDPDTALAPPTQAEPVATLSAPKQPVDLDDDVPF
jgi:hypothetical protein